MELKKRIVTRGLFTVLLLVFATYAEGQTVSPITITPGPATGLSVNLSTSVQNVPVIKLESTSSTNLKVTLPSVGQERRIYTAPEVRVGHGNGSYENIRPRRTEAVMRLRKDLPTIVIVPCQGIHTDHPECRGEAPELHHHEESYCDQDEHGLSSECRKDYKLNPPDLLDLRVKAPRQ